MPTLTAHAVASHAHALNLTPVSVAARRTERVTRLERKRAEALDLAPSVYEAMQEAEEVAVLRQVLHTRYSPRLVGEHLL